MPLRVLLCLVLSLAGATLGRADTFTVTRVEDGTDVAPGDRRCRDGAGYCTLRAAVQEVNALFALDPSAEHVIDLPAGVYVLALAGRDEDAAATGDLDFRANVLVRGAGVPVEDCRLGCTGVASAPTIIEGLGLDRVVHVLQGRLTLDNVVIQPHRASATVETRIAMGELVLANLAAHFAGQEPNTPVV